MKVTLDKTDILLAMTRLALINGQNHANIMGLFLGKDAHLLAGLLNEILIDKENELLISQMPSHSNDL